MDKGPKGFFKDENLLCFFRQKLFFMRGPMSVSYWKIVGDNIAQGLGKKTIQRLGAGGRFLGRAGAVAGIGFLAYELFKNYKANIEKEPAYKEMVILKAEMEKWTSAISCIGREPLEQKAYGSFNEGGAINALYRKRALGGPGIKAAEPQEAVTLIGRAIDYIMETENLLADDKFEEKRKALVLQLVRLREQIGETGDYSPIQAELAQWVDTIRPIESGYAARIYDCSQEIQKTLGSNAAWAALSMATLGIVKKPDK